MQFVNPLNVMGFLAVPLFLSNMLLIFGFAFAAYYAWKYTKGFYGERPKPTSWMLIITSLMLMFFSEVGAVLLFYILGPEKILIYLTIILMVTRALAGIFIMTGGWLLLKEV